MYKILLVLKNKNFKIIYKYTHSYIKTFQRNKKIITHCKETTKKILLLSFLTLQNSIQDKTCVQQFKKGRKHSKMVNHA